MSKGNARQEAKAQEIEVTSSILIDSAALGKKDLLHILHVDDDVCLLEVSKQILLMENSFEVENVTSVDEAFKKMEQQTYDAVVSDYEMPNKNGLEFLKELRDQKNDITFILFTGKGREDVAVKALNLGADSYINKNGSPETVYCELVDAINKTVERKKSRKLLAKSESRYHALVENSLQGIAILQASPLRIVFTNGALGKVLGYSPEELTSLSPEEIMSLVYHEDRAAFFKRMENRLRGELAAACFEFRAVRKDGSIIWLSSLANRVDYDGQPAVQGMFLDVNESRKMEEKLKANEKKYDTLVNATNTGYVIVDGKGLVLDANLEYIRLTGHKILDQIKGRSVTEWTAKYDLKRNAEEVKKCYQEGFVRNLEIDYVDENGKVTPIEINASVMKSEQDSVIVTICRDITERKKAEEALRKSDEKHRIISGITADVTFSCIKKGEEEFFVDWISGACEKIFGYSAKEIQEKGCWKFAVQHPDLPIFVEKITNLKLGQKSTCELMITNKNGSTRWLKVNSIVVEDSENPESLRLFGACTDITERKENEFELELERDKLEIVTDNIGAGLFLVDRDYKILYTNKMSKHHFGDLISKHCYLAFRNLNDVCPNCGVREIFENGKEIDVREHCFKDTKGDPGWLELTVRPIKDETGKVVAALELAVPITTRKKAEVNLLKNKALLLEAEKAGKIGGWEFDISTLTQSWTDETFRILEIDLTHGEPIVPQGIEFINPPYRAIANEAIQRAIEHGEPYDQEWEITTAKGNKRWVHAVAKANYENSKIKSISGSFQDITELKKAEEIRKVLESKVKQYSEHLKHMVDMRTAQLKDANERLVKAERLAAIGELAGMIGHDLRNPLAGIKNGIYFLKKKGTTISETQAKETLEIIDKAIDHSNKIINDLLDYAREMNLKLIKYAARPLVDEAVRMIQVPDRIQIENLVDEEACIWVDADKIIRVFVNLLQNAIDATPEKGRIEITSSQLSNFVEITFSDTGKGIPAEVLPKLFMPLFTTKAQGMGFGLAICKRIVEVHRGTIKVESVMDKGTKFIINLPVKIYSET
jgi:PAS domain S-box-containing protein